MLLPQAREAPVVAGFGRSRRADEIRALTPAIDLVRARDLVARRRLPRHAQAVVPRPPLVETALARVGLVEPLGRVERVLVHEHRRVVLDLVVARREPEPDAIAPQRPAERFVDVVVVLHRVRRAEAGVLQALREVVPLQGAVGEGEERRVGERVAAIARDEVDAHASGGHLGRQARRVNRDFLRGADVRNLPADVAAGLQRHRVDAVERDALIDRAAAVDGHAAAGALQLRTADVLAAALRARNHPRDRQVVARRRQRIDHVRREHLLLGHALHVHRGRCARDGHLLFDGADAQLRVDARHRRSGQLDPVADDRREARERERDAVQSRPQIDDLETAVAIRYSSPDLFDEHRTRCVDGNARQHGAGCVLHHAGDRRLRRRDRRQQEHP